MDRVHKNRRVINRKLQDLTNYCYYVRTLEQSVILTGDIYKSYTRQCAQLYLPASSLKLLIQTQDFSVGERKGGCNLPSFLGLVYFIDPLIRRDRYS